MGIWDDQVGSETFPAALAKDGPLAKAMQWLTGPNGGLANSMGMRPWYEQSPMDIAMGFAPSVGVGAIRAYHGSPHNFDKFDMSRIGTGEGAQAYGHGLYFAGNEGVARSYRDALGPLGAMDSLDHFLRRNRGINYRPEEIAKKLEGTRAEALAADPKAIEALRKLLPNYLPNLPVAGADLAHYRYLDDAAQRAIPGKMYEVDINANPAHLLDWDKPLSQQSEQVQQGIRKVTGPGNLSGDRGRTLYDMIANGFDKRFFTGGQQETTNALLKADIPGIKYLDQGSRGAGEGTSNYVMFDDKMIAIIRKYGLAGLAVPGALAPYAASQGDY